MGYRQIILPSGHYPSCPVWDADSSALADERQRQGLSARLLEQRERRIREAAYFLAQERGFEPGHDWEDWFAAELTVDWESRPWPTD